MKIFVFLCFLAVTQAGGLFPAPAQDILPNIDAASSSSPLGPMDLKQCVRLALEQSPRLKSSSFEIKVKRIDESDSRYALFPSFSVRTRFYVDPPVDVNGESRPYSLGFFAEPYNPFESYFALKARKQITQMAILGHLQVITGSIQRLGDAFLELSSLDRMSALQDQLLSLARQNQAYVLNRVKSGAASPLDLRLAEQEVQMVQLEKERLIVSRTVTVDGMKALVGLDTNATLEPDLREAKLQVLNGFDPATATLGEARSNSYELKIQSIKKELQSLNVDLAYARFLPNLLMGIENGDPLNRASQGGYSLYFGIEMPIWDGNKRAHNISRQKTLLKQFNAEEETREIDLGTAWSSAQGKLADAVAGLNLARSQEELAALKKRQSEISYQGGREPLSQFLADSKRSLEAQKNSELKDLEYVKAALALYCLSGKLSHHFVEPSSF